MSSTAGMKKRCLYEVVGVSRDCAADEIRSAFKREALRCHPDKFMQSGMSSEEATAAFQELVHAYEVLSDPIQRSWYNSQRPQIPCSNVVPTPSKGPIPDLFSFFTDSVFSGYSDSGDGFFKVYGDLFDKIHSIEVNLAARSGFHPRTVKKAPLMGNLNSPDEQVIAFYAYWLGFVTVMDFDRRDMSKKGRKKGPRGEYIDSVRRLAGFVRKIDKRVIDMQVKKKEKKEKKRVEKRRKWKELEKQKMMGRTPKLAELEEGEDDTKITFQFFFERRKFRLSIECPSRTEFDKYQFYCAACTKRFNFKSEKQWKKHEQSKKHKGKVSSHVEKEKRETDMKYNNMKSNTRKDKNIKTTKEDITTNEEKFPLEETSSDIEAGEEITDSMEYNNTKSNTLDKC